MKPKLVQALLSARRVSSGPLILRGQWEAALSSPSFWKQRKTELPMLLGENYPGQRCDRRFSGDDGQIIEVTDTIL